MKKWLKRTLIAISALFAVIIIIFIVTIMYTTKQKNILIKEVEILYNLDWNTEEIDMTIKASNRYGRLEKIIKNYYKELFQYRKQYDSISSDNVYSNVLSIYSLKKRKLDKSIIYVNETKLKSTNLANKITNLIDNDNIMKLVNNKNFNDKDIKLYKELMLGEKNENIMQAWYNLKKQNNKNYDLTIEALELLKNNPNAWQVKDDIPRFENAELSKEYRAIINTLVLKEKGTQKI